MTGLEGGADVIRLATYSRYPPRAVIHQGGWYHSVNYWYSSHLAAPKRLLARPCLCAPAVCW